MRSRGYSCGGNRDGPILSTLTGANNSSHGLSLKARDDQGREFTGDISGYTDIAGSDEREIGFTFSNLPSDARKLDLTFAIHESVFAEYLVKPSVP